MAEICGGVTPRPESLSNCMAGINARSLSRAAAMILGGLRRAGSLMQILEPGWSLPEICGGVTPRVRAEATMCMPGHTLMSARPPRAAAMILYPVTSHTTMVSLNTDCRTQQSWIRLCGPELRISISCGRPLTIHQGMSEEEEHVTPDNIKNCVAPWSSEPNGKVNQRVYVSSVKEHVTSKNIEIHRPLLQFIAA